MKKANACLTLILIALLFVHAVYELLAYILFYYNPVLSRLTGWLAAGAFLVHAVFSLINLCFFSDSRSVTYKRMNMGTVVQRISAVIMALFLPLHILMFNLLTGSFGATAYSLLEAANAVFIGALSCHAAVSFSRALISALI